MYMNYIFDTNEAAEKSLNEIEDVVDDYGFITVADVNNMFGIMSRYEDSNFGWTNVSHAVIQKTSAGYELYLPDKVKLERPTVNKSEMVNHPNHYMSETGLEAIDAIEAFTFDLKGIEAFDTGNALKYICRWKQKNGEEDLEKAIWYLRHLINHIKKEKEID